MKIQIPDGYFWVNGERRTAYKRGEVTGASLEEAWEKALAAGHDPEQTVMWRWDD